MQDHWLYIGETEARAALRATKCCTDQSNCCTATPLPQLLSHLLWTSSRHSRPVGDASLPLLQQDLSFALSAAGRSIPDMQQSCQVTLAGSDLGEGHSLSELMPLGGAVGMCTHTHTETPANFPGEVSGFTPQLLQGCFLCQQHPAGVG